MAKSKNVIDLNTEALLPELVQESTDPTGTQIEVQISVRVGRAAMAIQIRIGEVNQQKEIKE